MFDVMCKFFVLAEGKNTTLTFEREKITLSLFIICLQIMSSSGLDLNKFKLKFSIQICSYELFDFAISSFHINSVIAVAFNQVFI